jgi:preprotein translocase YajC subunit
MQAPLLLFADDPAPQPEGQTNTQTGTPPADGKPPADGGMGMMTWLFPILIVMALYMFLMRPKREDAERQKFLAGLQKNDEVLTASGILGNVVSVSETEDEVVVKLDDHLRVRMTKGSIIRNLSAEKRAKEAKEQQKDAAKEAPKA